MYLLYLYILYQLSQPHGIQSKRSALREITLDATLHNYHFNRILELMLILVINRLTYQGRDIHSIAC